MECGEEDNNNLAPNNTTRCRKQAKHCMRGHNHAHSRRATLINSDKMTLNQGEQHNQQVVSLEEEAERSGGRIPRATSGDMRQAANWARRRSSKQSYAPLSFLLPFVILFLLPTFTLEPRPRHEQQQQQQTAQDELKGLLVLGEDLLVELLRLPLDRLRIRAGSALIGPASAKEINTKLDLQEEETHMRLMAPEHRSMGYAGSGAGSHLQAPRSPDYANEPGEMVGAGSVEGGGPAETGQPQALTTTSGGALETRNDLPAVRALNVKCEKNHMTVNIVFDRPFYGMVFSKGHYNDQKCVHLPANSGQTSVNFDIHLGKCGMSSSEAGASQALATANQPGGNGAGQQPNGLFIENTIIIQYDPQVQEIYDQARKLRCTWYDYYEKSVTFRPYNVDMMDAVTANFLGDNIQCWMQIQVGKGPWASEVSGIVKIGQTMTMVLAIKDDENRFDMLVRNCVANDGKHQPIQLVDEYGCVARPKIMGKFQKVRNFGPAATVVSYAHFQAFKFPDSMSVHFQCVIQVCRFECPVPQCTGSGEQPAGIGAGAPGELAGGGAGDYAASGTEIVSSKEPLPVQHGGYFGAVTSPGAGYQNRSAVNLKLDESQGRVQVKLDTSMMTGSRGVQHPPAGALPPHLLHQAAGNEPSYAPPTGQRTYLATSGGAPPYYRAPATGGAGRPSQSGGRGGPVPPPGGPHAHFSPPYPASSLHRSSSQLYANRIGELPEEPAAAANYAELIATSGGHPLTTDSSPLALIASPRALRDALLNATTSSPAALHARRLLPANHRSRRSVSNPPADSTAVRTQRTIQVVSPDDVAFSLLSPGDESPLAPLHNRKRPSSLEPTDEVCFSLGKLALGALVTLLTLASSLVVVVYFVLRQRAKLDAKLCYFEPHTSGGPLEPTREPSPANLGTLGRRLFASPSLAGSGAEDEQQTQRRQQAEMQIRNKYLERLYSQFMPAAYWQQTAR